MTGYRRIAVLKGGLSAEREVSLVSGRECAAGLREAGYEVIEIDAGASLADDLRAARPDAVFNALHGRWGEDGCVQGLLELMGLPYSHSGVLASALAMDKTRAKTVFSAAGLPVVEGVLVTTDALAAAHPMAPPYVAKPNAEGSSVGVHMVSEGAAPPLDLRGADHGWMLIERYVPGRELTVSVMDGEPLAVTDIVSDGWYDYDAKYSAGGSRHILPADLPQDVAARCLEISAEAHRALGCRGLSRADLRYDDETGELILLEVNTQPGMTPTSLSPEQAALRGWSFPALVAWMIEDATCNR